MKEKFQITNKDAISMSLSARITSISMFGIMTIEFNKDMIKPLNTSMINDKVLLIRIKHGEDNRYQSVNWTINAFTKR